MFAKSTSRFKRVWKIHCRNKCHTITIFPPCALKTILELIENSFGTKWPFSVCDEHGVPTILSDCLESGIYTINETIGVSKKYIKKEVSRPEQKDDNNEQVHDTFLFPTAKELVTEWPPVLKTTFISWRHRKTFNLNIYDTSRNECDNGYFYIVGTSEEEKPRKILGLKVLSKRSLASLVTEDTLFYHMNKFLVDKEKQDILELNEMQYGPPMTEEYALNKAIETLKMTRKKKSHRGEWRLLDNPEEQIVSYKQERENIATLKQKKRKATCEIILRYAQQRINVTAEGDMNILRYASDGDIKVNVEFDNTASSAENNVITVKQTLQEKFDKLLKKQAKAYEKVKKTVNESEEIRIKVMKELHDANIRITRKLLFMHELDLEEKRRRENKLALQNNAAGIIQGRWKEKQARNNKKRKKKKKKRK